MKCQSCASTSIANFSLFCEWITIYKSTKQFMTWFSRWKNDHRSIVIHDLLRWDVIWNEFSRAGKRSMACSERKRIHQLHSLHCLPSFRCQFSVRRPTEKHQDLFIIQFRCRTNNERENLHAKQQWNVYFVRLGVLFYAPCFQVFALFSVGNKLGMWVRVWR